MGRTKKETMTTPKGTAVYPYLNDPDRKFNADGVYSVALRMEADHASAFMTSLDSLHEQHIATTMEDQGKKELKIAPLPMKKVEHDGKETGEVEFRFKLNAKGKSQGKEWQQRPTVFDSKGHKIDTDKVKIGSGSTIKVGFEVVPYYTATIGCGLSLRMKAVQVIDLVEYDSTNNATRWGFTDEGGYEFAPQEATVGDDYEESDF